MPKLPIKEQEASSYGKGILGFAVSQRSYQFLFLYFVVYCYFVVYLLRQGQAV